MHSKTPGMPASSDAHGFRCAHCPLVFVRRGGLKRHRRVAHGVLMPVSLEERGGDESDASLIAARVQASHSDSEPSYDSNASSFNASQQSDDHDEVSSTMPHKRRKLVSDASHPSKLPVVVSKALPLDHSSDVESSGSQRDVELKEGSHDRNPSHDKPRKCADILVKDNSTNDIPVSAQEK